MVGLGLEVQQASVMDLSGNRNIQGSIPPPMDPYPAETTPLINSFSGTSRSSKQVPSPVVAGGKWAGREEERSEGAEEDQVEEGVGEVEKSDQHKNKDFQLIHVPSGRVRSIFAEATNHFRTVDHILRDQS